MAHLSNNPPLFYGPIKHSVLKQRIFLLIMLNLPETKNIFILISSSDHFFYHKWIILSKNLIFFFCSTWYTVDCRLMEKSWGGLHRMVPFPCIKEDEICHEQSFKEDTLTYIRVKQHYLDYHSLCNCLVFGICA